MRLAASTEGIVWKNSPIKTDMGSIQKVHIGVAKQEEKKPTLLQKLGYKANMTKEEFAKFLETATTLFDDDESPVKTRPSKDPKIAQQTQSQFDLLFASPNESFQATPYHYEEEDIADPTGNIMNESMIQDEPEGELSIHLTEDEVDYRNIIKRITNSNKVNNGIPHPFAPVDISMQDDDDDCKAMTQPSLQHYQDISGGEVNVASSIDSNTSFVREIRAKSNPLASSRDFDANSISFGGDLMQNLSQYRVPVDVSGESFDIKSIIAKNRATINRSKGIVVSEAQKYLDAHSMVKDRSAPSVSQFVSSGSHRASAESSHQHRQALIADSHSELMAAMDDGMLQHWTTLQKANKEIEKHISKGATVSHFEVNLQLQLDHLLSMSSEALQTIVFTQVRELVFFSVFNCNAVMCLIA